MAVADRVICSLKDFFALETRMAAHSPTASPGRGSSRQSLRLGPQRFGGPGDHPRDEWASEWRGHFSGRGASALMRSGVNDDIFVDDLHSGSGSTPSLVAELYAQAELERPRTASGGSAATHDPPALIVSRRGRIRLTSFGRYLVPLLLRAHNLLDSFIVQNHKYIQYSIPVQ